MPMKGHVLLTGATGLLGRYLLRDLIAAGHQVAVLARGTSAGSAKERIGGIIASWGGLPPSQLPIVLNGNLRSPRLGLSEADLAWVAVNCSAVVHSGANIALRGSFDGEPRATNVEGTRELIGMCEEFDIADFHHVSTAYVCGDRSGTIREDELECGQGFRNDYERSKYDGERMIRDASLRPTIYRPAIIVGDSQNGFTSTYHGFYRCIDLAYRLAESVAGHRHLPLRLAFDGDEPRNLIPVDWVSQAIVRILSNPALHGRTYHLTPSKPTLFGEMVAATAEVLGIRGMELTGPGELTDPTDIDLTFLNQLQEYLPYLGGDQTFDASNTRSALPDLIPPPVNRELLIRLIRFAVADGWGRKRKRRQKKAEAVEVG
jgi:thioester reductase-like protein